jgi:hypothetical protein
VTPREALAELVSIADVELRLAVGALTAAGHTLSAADVSARLARVATLRATIEAAPDWCRDEPRTIAAVEDLRAIRGQR